MHQCTDAQAATKATSDAALKSRRWRGGGNHGPTPIVATLVQGIY
jgi:hypothetical protein